MALEEGAKTARTFIESMREQPLALALALMNFLLLGFLYYGGVAANQERHRELELLYDNRKYVTDVLASCIQASDLEKLQKSIGK